MVRPQPIFDEREAEDEASDAEALADLDASRTISHEDMKAWLQTWGAPAAGRS
jgi:predicted transcriptional regulator